MAKIDGNVFVKGIRGMIGEQIVYKERNGKQYAAAAPTKNENSQPTPNQARHRQRVARATKYAQVAIKNPELKSAYQAVAARNQSAYNVAWQDAFHLPVVRDIIANGYKGNAGDTIMVQATDNFKVSAVKVSIFDRGGVLIEEGQAVARGAMWMYIAQRNHEEASRIVATAFDLPGNEGLMEVLV